MVFSRPGDRSGVGHRAVLQAEDAGADLHRGGGHLGQLRGAAVGGGRSSKQQIDTTIWKSQVIGCLALSWTIVALTMVKGMQVHLTLLVTTLSQSYGKVVYFITLFPYVVLTTFLIMGSQQVRQGWTKLKLSVTAV